MTFIYGLLDTCHITCCLSGPWQSGCHTHCWTTHTWQDSHGTFHSLRGATMLTINRNPELQWPSWLAVYGRAMHPLCCAKWPRGRRPTPVQALHFQLLLNLGETVRCKGASLPTCSRSLRLPYPSSLYSSWMPIHSVILEVTQHGLCQHSSLKGDRERSFHPHK